MKASATALDQPHSLLLLLHVACVSKDGTVRLSKSEKSQTSVYQKSRSKGIRVFLNWRPAPWHEPGAVRHLNLASRVIRAQSAWISDDPPGGPLLKPGCAGRPLAQRAPRTCEARARPDVVLLAP